jgi:SM-20-related protein
MTTRIAEPTLFDEERIVEIADTLASAGWVVFPHFVPTPQIETLRTRVQTLAHNGALRPASIGRGENAHTNAQIRSDGIFWIENGAQDTVDIAARDFGESLVTALNAQLFAGLDHAELHYALYPPGARYGKHLDRHRDSDARVISMVLYLNETWQADWGGELVLYGEDARELTRVSPRGGTLVLFLSERFPHEVLPATQPRMSLTGWLRRRTVC